VSAASRSWGAKQAQVEAEQLGRPSARRLGVRSWHPERLASKRVDAYAWTWNGEALVLAPTLAVGYALAARIYRPARARIAAFVLAVGLMLAVFATPVQTIALHYLLAAHLLQNVVMAEWAPALIVLAVPPAAATGLARVGVLRTLTRPAVALPVWLGTYFAWHVPAAYDFALRHPATVLHVEHLSYLAAGLLLWWPIVHAVPHHLTSGAKAAYVFAAFVLGSPLGLLLALVPSAVYSTYRDGPGLWGLDPLADQQLAGLTMAAEQAVVFFAVFAVCFLRFLREEEARGATFQG
jgi:cytochrome c oxidase assembly factor CtaG